MPAAGVASPVSVTVIENGADADAAEAALAVVVDGASDDTVTLRIAGGVFCGK